ncbi:MAG: metallophosphoesterase [Bacteroidaceae bacterium]|jgi:predicted MPP superfamily phosphohydrolase|nr:metallophosphoesterase [Bacteroidaceae bacterium]
MYARRWTNKRWLRLLWFAPSLLIAISAGIIIGSNDMKPEHQAWVSIFMFFFLACCAPKALFMLWDGLGHAINWMVSRGAKNREEEGDCIFVRIFRIIGMALAIFTLALLSFGYFVGRHYYVIHRQTFYFPDLPKRFEGYRIAQFSDMHIGTLRDGHEEDAKKIVELINAQHCDAILFTGDLVNHQSIELDGFQRDLSKLSAPDGVYAVMGNHDYSMYIKYPSEKEREADVEELHRRIRSYGWTLLLNEHRVLRRGTDSLIIAGVENDGLPPWPALGDLPKTMKGLKRSCFTVLMSHDPTHWRRAILPRTSIQLTLSGHTHAGQFKVFGWSPVSYVYREWSGAYAEGNQVLNVSDGIGAVMFPFRFGAWPEVNVITLRRGTPQKQQQ